MIKIFVNNFIFKDAICALETIDNHKKTRHVTQIQKQPEIKRITKGLYIDVYNVYSTQSGDHEGILYIKGLQESIKMKELSRNSIIELKCKFNCDFNKWEPILD